MEKILVTINTLTPNKKTMDFALYLARLTKSRITGVVLENTIAHKIIQRDLHGFPVGFADNQVAKNKITAGARIEETISGFKKYCSDNGVLLEIHRDHGVPIEDVIVESRFSDMLIVDAASTFSQGKKAFPGLSVEDILENAQCPVIVAPEEFEELNEIIFCYNGAFDSIFAIKMFTYLFPQMMHKKLIILQVNADTERKNSEDRLFMDWIKSHYDNFQYELINGPARHTLADFLFRRKNIFIVMGAYGRDALSAFFKKTMAESLVKTITQPVFISHL